MGFVHTAARFAVRLAGGVAVAAASVLVTAGAPAAARAAEPLKIAYSDWPGYTAWEVAIQKGWFKEAGVEVDFKWFEYGPCVDAFVAGKVDGAALVTSDALPAGANGKAATLVVLEDFSDGNDMIIGKPGIKSIKDLKGKKVGIELNLVEHLLLLKALEVNGMTDQDVTLVATPTNDTPQTLASGGVDAVGCWYPVSGQALKQVPGSKPLFTSAEAKGLIYDGLFVSRESLSQRRDDWKKIVGVWFRVVEYVNDPATRDDAVKIMAAKVQVDPAVYAKSLSRTHLLGGKENQMHFSKADGLDSVYGSMKNADAFNTKYGVYKTAQPTEGYIDPSLAKEVFGAGK